MNLKPRPRSTTKYRFHLATEAHDFEAIYRLNHAIFAEELGQYCATDNGRLVDKFDDKNTYFVAKRGSSVVGMVSVHGQPPFSVADKLADRGVLEELGPKLLEVRLLAVEPGERKSRVVAGLFFAVFEFATSGRYSHLIISGVEKNLEMYRHLGFQPMGAPIASGKAVFTPMAVAVDALRRESVRRFRRWAEEPQPICLLPGPVQPSPAVQAAFARPAISHRGSEFLADFDEIRVRLRELSGGMEAALFPGSGTFANDVAGATIAARAQGKPGLILVNGEFGERLVRHAQRWRLDHTVLRWDWGCDWDFAAISREMRKGTGISWIWAVHLETSTGLLNDAAGLIQTAEQDEVDVFVDCVSSFGALPFELNRAALVTTVSGKALGAYAGAAMVLVNPRLAESLAPDQYPTSLDLPSALESKGPLTTFSSPCVKALNQALSEQTPERWAQYCELGKFVRSSLRRIGIEPFVPEHHAAPVVTTFAPRPGECRSDIVTRCAQAGFTIASESGYLQERKLLQIATMGEISIESIAPLFSVL